jgi:SAM-dependent methyltransferase
MQQKSDGVSNLFVHRSAAQRYAAGRPYFHPQVISWIGLVTKTPRFAQALDIACGTGQSSRALADIADRVDAIDISAEMLSEAEPHPRVHYQVASAEKIPFANRSFELATVGLAFHWFDQAAFLTEARRVLKPGAWLVVYNSGFNGEMVESSDFRHWAWEIYPKRFPTPPRRSVGVSAELVEPFGFSLIGQESFAHQERMTPDQLTGYLLTQTNVIAAVDSGSTPLDEASTWIMAGMKPFFAGETGTMKFSGMIWFMRRSAAA